MKSPPERGVAIVGVAVELPSGDGYEKNLDYKTLFPFLLNKEESYSKIPSDRLNVDALRGTALGQVLPENGSFLKDLDKFDYLEFGVTAKDARAMPVSVRKLIEVAFLSLLDAGIDYRGQNVGCYMSGIVHDMQMISGQDEAECKGSFSGLPSAVANRVSYHLDLRGPSIPVDTACSASCVALHLGVQSILNGECEAALVGGAQINIRFSDWFNYTQAGILSPDGKCKPFDASANGFGRAEGVAVMVLKPLAKAIADGDHIYGTVLGTGINCTGSLAPVYAPVASSQEEAMRKAFAQAQRQPREVDYMELHATGTARGDPTEANWVGKAFSRDDELILGSLKGNLGHLEISSFLGSLAKVCGVFESGLIPPNANLDKPNPAIMFDEYRMRAPTSITRLPCRAPNGRSLVAMTTSGVGGVNGHAVIESAPLAAVAPIRASFWREGNEPEVELTVVGGLSPRSTAALVDAVKANVSAADARLALARRARGMTWRSYAVSPVGKEPRFSEPVLASKGRQPLVFVFSGQGPQHFEMGRELFRTSRVFHESVLEMDAVFERVTGESLIKTYGLFAEKRVAKKALGDIWPIAITLPSLTVIQLALFDTLVSLGLKPDALIGHSAGETALLYASGSASRTATMELSIARGRGMSVLEDQNGTMAAVNCAPAQAESIIAEVKAELGPGQLEIGCYNTGDAITLSGSVRYIDVAVAKADALGIFARKLRTRVPVHSSMMELGREEYQAQVGKVFADHAMRRPSVPIYSAKTGRLLDVEMDADYFWTNTCGPVRFTQAMTALVETYGDAAFLELSPHPVLVSYIATLAGRNAPVVCPLRRPNVKKGETEVEVASLLTALGQLAVAGNNQIDYAALVGANVQPSRELPAYPFAPKHVPYQAPSSEIARATQARNGPLNYPQLRINGETHPSLVQHVIKGEPVMPAAGYLEMALEFGARKLWNAEFLSIISLSSARPVPVQVHLDENYWAVKSSPVADVSTWPPKYDRLHAEGYLSMDVTPEERKPAPLALDVIRARCASMDIQDTFYEDMKYFAEYGPEYRRIFSLHRGTHNGRREALVGVNGLTEDLAKAPAFIIHPAILDAAVHAAVHPELTEVLDKGMYYLPSKVRLLVVHDLLLDGGMPKEIYTHIVSRQWSPAAITYDCYIVNADGDKLCTIEGLEVARHGDVLAGQIPKRFALVNEPTSLSLSRSRSSSPVMIELGPDGNLLKTPSEEMASTDRPALTHLVFRCGEEMLVKDRLAQYDAAAERTLWLTAQTGEDGAAALGFSRSLRREYPSWTVRLAVLDSMWSVDDHSAAVAQLAESVDVEDEVVVDANGGISVPRIQEMVPPTRTASFDPAKPWRIERGHVLQTLRPHVEDGQALVEDLVYVQATETVKGFIGRVAGTTRPVMGITDGPVANYAVVPVESLVSFSDAPKVLLESPPLLALTIAALAVGTTIFSKPDRLRSSTIVVTHADSAIGASIISVFSALKLEVTAIPSSATPFDLGTRESLGAKLIVSGYSGSTNNILRRALARDGKFFAWNDTERGLLAMLREEPSTVADALRLCLSTMPLERLRARAQLPLDLVPNAPAPGERVEKLPVFDPYKAFLLVGGLSSWGLQIAAWMYEHGTRHVILTSQSGPSAIQEHGDVYSRRLLDYLTSLPDFTLDLATVDAASTTAMTKLVKSVTKPLGGCMLLNGVLHDGALAQQTADSFGAAYRAQVDAFKVLEKVCDIPALDLLVLLSSVSGFVGGVGQTNYAAGNTAVESLIAKYDNAFTVITPLTGDSSPTSSQGIWNWGSTTREICVCIGDGMRKLDDEPYTHYIPDMNWNKVAELNGRSPRYAHLIEDDGPAGDGDSNEASLENIVKKMFDVAAEDFSADVPLTTYGLDSLSASRLAVLIKPFVTMSQMQLLADVSLNDIRAKLEE